MSEVPTEPQPDESNEPTESPELPTEDEQAEEAGEGEGSESPDEPAQPEPETEPPQPEGLTQAEAEARFQKADKSFGGYQRRVKDLWGDEGEYLLPVSISPSAPPGFIDVRDAGRVPEEMQRPIQEFFGLARARDYKPDPQVGTCPGCEGEGLTATGSHVAGNDTRKCPQCRGFGYVPPPGAATNGETPASDFHQPIGEAVAPLSDEERDMWGEAHLLPDGRENPNYGKMPQHKITVSPWGVTANLTAQDAPVPVEG